MTAAAMGQDPARAPTVALFGLFGSGNTGNDASLEAMLTSLYRIRPEAQLLCICGEPGRIARDFGIRGTPLHANRFRSQVLNKVSNLLRPFRELKGLELLIVPGTGALDNFGTRWTGLPLSLFAWCVAARLRGAVVAFVSVGAGPITDPLSRWLIKKAIGTAQYRSYRDQLSRQFLESIGFSAANDPVYPDLAFLLPAPSAPRPERPKPLAIGLGVMTYRGWENDARRGDSAYAGYIEKISRFAVWLLDRGHVVHLLLGDNTDQRAADDLKRIVTELRPNMPAQKLQASRCDTLFDVMRKIAGTDIVVATRFHNIVAALKLGCPVISIGYAEKNRALMTDAGLGSFCQSIETLDIDLLTQQFTDMVAAAEAWRSRLREVQSRYHARLLDQEAVLSDCLFPHRRPSGCKRSRKEENTQTKGRIC